jgi:spore germination cell wall hydrolase CwlJ-like protein
LLAIAALTILLLAGLMMCFAPLAMRRSPDHRLDLDELMDPAPPSGLLGSTRIVAEQMADEPASLHGEQAVAQNARTPFAALGPAARPFRFTGSMPERLNARACLAAAMVYEAGDDAIGQLAVGQVILNRVRHPAFPASVCGVVTQGSDRATGCQFTFTCDGSLMRSISLPVRTKAFAHADLMLDGMVFAGVGLATHYHTDGVYPWWSPRLEKIARMGSHLFFRWPGFWGSSRVFAIKRKSGEASAALFPQFAPLPVDGSLSIALDETSHATRSADDAIAADTIMTGHPHGAVQAPRDPGPDRAAAIPKARRLLSLDVSEVGQHSSSPAAPALHGARLLRMFSEEGIFFLQLIPGPSVAARKRAAEQLCGGRSQCQVYGWWSAEAAPQSTQLDALSRASLAFSFVRRMDRNARLTPPSAIAM